FRSEVRMHQRPPRHPGGERPEHGRGQAVLGRIVDHLVAVPEHTGVTRARGRGRTKPDRAIGFPGLTTRLPYRACPPGRPLVVDLIVVDWGRVAAGEFRIRWGTLGEIGHEPVDVPLQ